MFWSHWTFPSLLTLKLSVLQRLIGRRRRTATKIFWQCYVTWRIFAQDELHESILNCISEYLVLSHLDKRTFHSVSDTIKVYSEWTTDDHRCGFEPLLEEGLGVPHPLFVQKECDQIWRNFATLAKFCKSLGNFEKLKLVFGNFLNLLWKIVMLLGKFPLLWLAQYWKIIYPSGHTAARVTIEIICFWVQCNQMTLIISQNQKCMST